MIREAARSVWRSEDGFPGGGRLALTASGEAGVNPFPKSLPRRETVLGAGFPRGLSLKS